jgi:hypothetical protein
VLFIILLLSYDSLPPLPDLSQITFPEPPLLIIMPENRISVRGGAGEFIFGSADIRYRDFLVCASYTNRFYWDRVRYGNGSCSYAHGFSHFWIRPTFESMSLKRDDEYMYFTPGFDFAKATPWSVMQGRFTGTIWSINATGTLEAGNHFEIIFDRMMYKPQLVFDGLYTRNKYIQLCGSAFHIQDFHICVLSPVSDYFPSPHIHIEFLQPSVRIQTEVRSGAVLQTLRDRVDPHLPLHYTMNAPVESLRVAARLGTVIDLYNHSLRVSGTYRDWHNLAVPSYDFALQETLGIQEIDIDGTLRIQHDYRDLHIANILVGTYSWRSFQLAFCPRYTISDTTTIEYNLFYAAVAVQYRSAHSGIVAHIPAGLIIDPQVGLRYHDFTFFLTVMNSTGAKGAYYDGYDILPRAFAAGIRFRKIF